MCTPGIYNYSMRRGLTNEPLLTNGNHLFIMAPSKIADTTVSFVGIDPELCTCTSFQQVFHIWHWAYPPLIPIPCETSAGREAAV